MHYFVTGASGFIGKRLVRQAARAQGRDRVLPGARRVGEADRRAARVLGRDDKARDKGRASRSPATCPARARHRRGRAQEARRQGRSISSISPRSTTSRRDDGAAGVANIDGTRNVVEFANAIGAGCFHHVSSIAAAGLYEGVFREDMFDEAENLDHPYFPTKHESEKIVRNECQDAVAHLPARHRGRRLARPAKWTRSTARTTSSS